MTNHTIYTGAGKSITLSQFPPEAWTSLSGQGADSSELMKLYGLVATLYRGVEIRANGVASMPYQIKTRGGDAIYTSDEDDKVPDGLPWLGLFSDLLARTEAASVLGGRAYWERQGNVLNSKTAAIR